MPRQRDRLSFMFYSPDCLSFPTILQQFVRSAEGIVTTTSGSKSIAVLDELALKDGFDDHLHGEQPTLAIFGKVSYRHAVNATGPCVGLHSLREMSTRLSQACGIPIIRAPGLGDASSSSRRSEMATLLTQHSSAADGFLTRPSAFTLALCRLGAPTTRQQQSPCSNRAPRCRGGNRWSLTRP